MGKPTLIVNGVNLTSRLASMTVSKEVTYKSVVTTRDGIEKPMNQFIRTVIDFTLLPSTPAQLTNYFNAMRGTGITVKYYDPYKGQDQTKVFRLVGSLEELFLLDAVDGHRYYSGKPIQLRQNGVG